MKKQTVYLAGKITDDPDYKQKFQEAAHRIEGRSFVVLSPAILPEEGFGYEAYIRMSSAMLDECDIVCFLPDWEESRGAVHERSRAEVLGKIIVSFEGLEKCLRR